MTFQYSSRTFAFAILVTFLSSPSASVQAQSSRWPDPIANDVLPYSTVGLSHGPLIGGVSDHSIRVWLRTRQPTAFEVLCGTSLPFDENARSIRGETHEGTDLAGVVEIDGLSANTRYYYAIRINGQLADLRDEVSDPWPSFRTLPNRNSYLDPLNNPQGKFNVCFAVGHCAAQSPDVSGGMYASTPAYRKIEQLHRDEISFGIVNGDVIYEEQRDGTIDGVRNNYKLYFSRGRSFSSLFKTVPALFTFDDHDVGWDIHGCGQIGLGEGKHLIRDIGLKAYEEYLSWANYRGSQSGRILLGRASVEANSGILIDPKADFRSLDLDTVSTLHLGNYTRDEGFRSRKEAPKNAGVYGIEEVLDAHRLRITPAPKFAESLPYSIGTHHYYDWKIGNCHFFALDTRGERSKRNPSDRNDPNLFLLSEAQEKWFLQGVQNTDAEFIFVISPDPWTLYHTAAHVGGDDTDDKGDGFPSFLHQRERLLGVLDTVQKPILIFTGDVHAAASVRITNNVWEMMCGPLGSTGHPIGTLGNPPRGGTFLSMNRKVDIRWVSGFPNNLPYQRIRNTYYGIVQVNNVLRTAGVDSGYQYSAYDQPQVVVRWHDGYTGELAYAESITLGDARD